MPSIAGHRIRQKLRSHSFSSETLIPVLKWCTRTSEISQIHAHMIKTGLDLMPFPQSKLLASSILDMSYACSIFYHIQNPNLFMFNTMLRGYSISESPKEAIFLFNSVRAQGIFLDQFSFISTLKSCAREVAIQAGQCIHGIIVKFGFEFFVDVRNTLLHVYSVCGRVGHAHRLFDESPKCRDLVSWNALMRGYLQMIQPTAVMNLFRQMRWGGFMVSNATVLTLLSASADLGDCGCRESVHCYCIKNSFVLDMNVVTGIMSMYVKSSCMNLAQKLFDQMPKRDIVSWNCIIDGYAKNGRLQESLDLLWLMKGDGIKPNSATLAGLLSACASSGTLAIGQHIHQYLEDEHLEVDVVLGTALINMYSKCGVIEKAVEVFNWMQSKDVKSWTAMIAGFGFHGQPRIALQLFNKMMEERVRPSEVTFLAVLSACSHGGLVMEGKKHFESMVQEYGFLPRIEHYGCVIDLLGRAGFLEEAYELIKSLPIRRDATAWRALLAACRVHGNVNLGELVDRSLMELDEKHPTDSILLSGAYAAAGRWDDVARMRDCEEENVMVRKEAGCSSIEMAG